MKIKKEVISWKKAFSLGSFIAVTFWILDLISHDLGGTETLFYHISKIFNALILGILVVKFFWPKVKKSQLVRVLISIAMWGFISIYYFLTSYATGFVQSIGIAALRGPPTFFGLPPWMWFFAHSFYFWIALNLGTILDRKKG